MSHEAQAAESPRRTARLSALDGSFLRLESAAAHMHVGWSAVFAVPDGGARPTLAALRERVADRLDGVAWCRWRLEAAPLGLIAGARGPGCRGAARR